MAIPKPNYNPPFNITRASHSVLHVKDLAKSRAFYVDLIGLIVSDEDKDTIYLRGVAEVCHHSLVLKRARRAASRAGRHALLHRGGFGKGESLFREGRPAGAMGRAAVPGPDAACQRSARRAARILRHHDHQAAAGGRVSSITTARCRSASIISRFWCRTCSAQLEFYMGLGFRLSEYIAPDGSDDPLFVFLQRKGNPHDIVFAPGAGPRLHHAAFSIPGIVSLLLCLRSRLDMGFAENIEFGPGRHGPGHGAVRLYARSRRPPHRAVQHALSMHGYRGRAGALGRFRSPASGAGSCRRARCGSPRRAVLPASSRASRRTRAIR